MRKFKGMVILLSALLLVISSCFMRSVVIADGKGQDKGVPIDEDHFPDYHFRLCLNNRDKNHDGFLSKQEIESIEMLSCYGEGIENLKGIEFFYNLEQLECSNNKLTTLDLSYNDKLSSLTCNKNLFTTLDLHKNRNLERLECSNNKLTTLNVSKNTALKSLICDGNQLTTLDVSKNTALKSLTCDSNQLTTLDLSYNTELLFLFCSNNQLTTLDLPGGGGLNRMDCSNNQLSTLNISNADLCWLNCSFNNIKTINITNNSRLVNAFENGQLVINAHHTYDSNFIVTNTHYTAFYYALDGNNNKEGFETDKTVVVSTSTPTTKPTGSSSTNPTSNPTTKPNAPTTAPTVKPTVTPTSSNETGVSGFIDRLYTLVLGRAADQGGKDYWMNKVMKEGKTGADIAKGFLYSPEFLNKTMTNSDFLDILYNVFFNRAADQGGKNHWLSLMAGGMSKQDVIMGFINSTEWANVCLSYGIPSGGTGIPNKTVEPNEKVIAFAERLYTTCLGRAADKGGLEYWAGQLANMKITGTSAAHGFFFSTELLNKNIPNDDYITRLYRTFMGREPDQGGFDYWMGRFAAGASREDVFQGFAQSKEFGQICSDYGILR